MTMPHADTRTVKLMVCLALSLLLFASLQPLAFSAEKWPGVDETVVEKYAREQGREAVPPLINTDRGDLLLFVFLAAGAIAGFAAGYFWRMLIVEKPATVGKKERKTSG